MLIDKIYIYIFLNISLLISIIIFSLSYILMIQKYDFEKLSSYECGFQPFEDTRNKFNIKFYLVAILFIIFDLEVSFLFPWCINFISLGYFSYWVVYFFLFVLTIGFIYEWMKNALDWS